MNTTTIARCDKCQGRGEVPSGYVDAWGRSCWRVCSACDGLGAVEVEPEPEPTPPAAALTVTDRFQIAGATVTAPGFTPESFDRAIGRAFAAGLTLAPTDRGDVVTVTNPMNGHTHTTTRRSCTCKAGQHGHPCMHVAYACMVADVWHALPTSAPMPAAA